jgi:single-stranded-DNA-specific exonuclease
VSLVLDKPLSTRRPAVHDAWTLAPPPTDNPRIPIANDVIRALLIRRGIGDGEDFRRFAAPSLDDLHDPVGIHGMTDACKRIERAVRDNETILIYGDYDVDGVTSIVLLQTVLRSLGADAAHVVPHRLVDGYGLKSEVLERVLRERDVRLVITVDCGITSIDPVSRALDRGIDVIITDHHLPPGVLPAAAAVLNPKQPGCTYPFKELAGVGVAFKLCCELIRRNNKKTSLESLLKIAAIGTVADVAPLIGENRTIAWIGLNGLANPRNPGLRALIRRLGLLGRPLRAVDVGFKIGPRINAAGRLSSAETAIELFAARSEEEAGPLCAELDRMNAERQVIGEQVLAEAETQVAGLRGCEVADLHRNLATSEPRNRFIIAAGENWHRGVVGLVAGRLANKYHRPALVISIDGERCTGSGRSIPTVNLHEQLEGAAELFTHFGGHEFACGFSLERRNLEPLRERLAEQFASLDEALFRREAQADGELELGMIDGELMKAHELLQPFGAGNPQPLFVIRNAEVMNTRTFATDCTELAIEDGTGKAVALIWPSSKTLAPRLERGMRADLLVQLEPDAWSVSKLVVVDCSGVAESRRREVAAG